MAPTRDGEHPRHYPLDGLDLSFSRYHHRTLDVADIVANRFMDRWLFPHRDPAAQHTPRPPPNLLELRLVVDNPLIDLRPNDQDPVFRETMGPHGATFPRFRAKFEVDPTRHAGKDDADLGADVRILFLSQSTRGGGHPCLPAATEPAYGSTKSTSAVILALLRRHVFETSHPEIRPWLRWSPRGYPYPSPTRRGPGVHCGCCPTHFLSLDETVPSHALYMYQDFIPLSTSRRWKPEDTTRARELHVAAASFPRDGRVLLSQGSILRDARRDLGPLLWTPGPSGLPPPVPNVMAMVRTTRAPAPVLQAELPVEPGDSPARRRTMVSQYYTYSTTLRTRRAASEPPPGAYMYTTVKDAYVHPWMGRNVECDAMAPESYLRQRLSFDQHLMPLYVPCPPLSEVDHRTRRRSLSRRHIARMFHSPSRISGCLPGPPPPQPADPSPPAAAGCLPFPVYHTAKNCPVVCSRACGARLRPGHAGHPRAMTCRSRCCMCGIRGHTGKECRLKRCRCGEQHLGQDCGWKPDCRVDGCDRYLCGVHCRECGSTERPFVGWRCAACLGNGEPAGGRAEYRPAKMRRGKRKEGKKGGEGGKGSKGAKVEKGAKGVKGRGRK
ncbi:uncharacterized protein DNG_01531 [Cephalotrichum gorgonifer]|uniref:Uncharacterized protein n=1 Tax=Cephalotrichum gorgonifer TaxID=2041049 RepID=A0AAE8MR22_9PEZI|nr:uncharacterized protein DNG_01531 [Cephalotrichum gorgonifer]